MPSLKDRLLAARPGDLVEFTGRQSIGKIQGVTGREGAPVTLVGADASAVLVPDRSYRYAVFRPENCQWFQWGGFAIDGEGWAERGIQVFGCQNVKGYDLDFRGNRYDGIHLANTTRASFHRCRFDGSAGEWLRPGVGPHSVYVAEGCSVIDAWDAESTGYLGAPVQVNGQDGREDITGVTFRRLRVRAWRDGFGVNLLGCANVVLEDLDLETAEGEANGGVYADEDTNGISVVRWRMVLPPGKPEFTGSISKQPGTPAPPQFGGDPEPEPEPPPDETGWEAKYRELEAEMAEARAWYAGAPACLRE